MAKGKKTLGVILEVETIQDLKRLAKEQRRSVSGQISFLVKEFVENNKYEDHSKKAKTKEV